MDLEASKEVTVTLKMSAARAQKTVKAIGAVLSGLADPYGSGDRSKGALDAVSNGSLDALLALKLAISGTLESPDA